MNVTPITAIRGTNDSVSRRAKLKTARARQAAYTEQRRAGARRDTTASVAVHRAHCVGECVICGRA